MKLYEFEGHKILTKVGIQSPFFVVVSDIEEIKQARKRLEFPIVAKVQVLSGKRGKGGGIKICTTEKQLLEFTKKMFGSNFNGEEVRFIALAENVKIKKEYYLSITYDSVKKIPFVMFNSQGGVDIEEVQKRDPASILKIDIDPLAGPRKKDLEKVFKSHIANDNSSRFRLKDIHNIVDFILRFWDAFWKYDCRLVEINPLALTKEGEFMSIDAKIILDDTGFVRHKDLEVLPKGSIAAVPSMREVLAKEIDADDYRGTAGSTFIELDGSPRFAGEADDIAVLASGGGASLMIMDSLIDAGGKPANYTEYSGNPPREKVEKLTKITLSREDLCGCLVAGAVANFTDIYETLSGFVDGLRQIKPKPLYPIVIRRGGPRQQEAYEMLAKVAGKEGFDIHLFGPESPISVACREMVKLSGKFKIENLKLKI